ncbi:MAG: HEAT repeat domain-containing protein [Chloroflexota bacterium]|nr:HEAT repeat domain-containing protein [Chloroflexota bacterium]
MTLDSYIAELSDESSPVKRSGLLQLSSLTRDDARDFRRLWRGVGRERRREVLGALTELSEDNLELDFSAIFRVCLSDECEIVREQATRGLLETDDRALIRPLIGLLSGDPSENVRAAAAISLSKYADLAQQGKLMSRDSQRVRDALLAVIANRDEARDVRRRAIEAVGSFDTDETSAIVRAAYESEDSAMRQSAIYAMGRSSNSVWLPIALSETNAADPAIRYEAANACGLLGEESTIPQIAALIGDEDIEVQCAAAIALGNIGGPTAKRALRRALDVGEDALTEAAAEALENLEFDEDPLGLGF